MKTYAFVYLGATLLAIITTPMVIRIARWLNIVDTPDVRKVHSRPVPRIGGVAIFLSVMAPVIPVLFAPNLVGESFRLMQSKLLVVLLATAGMFLVGLLDDIKGLRVRAKLLAQLAAAMVVCFAGIRVESIAITEGLILHLGWFSWLFTLVWIVGITNAVNLSDGLDGLAAGISAVACGVIAILAVHNGQTVMAVLMLALLGSLLGFLFFNFDPARIFMGDSGSLFLGFTIASASVLCATKTETVVGLALPVLALGIPIFDTLFSTLGARPASAPCGGYRLRPDAARGRAGNVHALYPQCPDDRRFCLYSVAAFSGVPHRRLGAVASDDRRREAKIRHLAPEEAGNREFREHRASLPPGPNLRAVVARRVFCRREDGLCERPVASDPPGRVRANVSLGKGRQRRRSRRHHQNDRAHP